MDQVDYINGKTRLYGIVGDPIAQVRSPEMVTHELQRRGLNAILVPLHVARADFARVIPHLMQLLNLDGLVMTIPFKAQALNLAQSLGLQAQAVGALNALARRKDGTWAGDMFDGMGCVQAFARRGLALRGKSVLLIGLGGAGGAIAGAFVAQSRPDGYTLMMADLGANCIGKELQPALNYDPMRAFTPVSHLVNLPIAVIVPANLPVQNLEELMARARARADGIQYASPGVGHVSHLAAELLGRRAGVKLTAVHYRSGADVMRSLIQGETEFSFPSVSTALPFIREGRVRALAIGTPAPVAALPGVPSVAASFPGFEAMTWHGIVGPAGMPDDVVAAANRVFRSIITSTEVKETVQRVQAAEVIASSPAEFAALITRDHAKWTPVIREGNIRAE